MRLKKIIIITLFVFIAYFLVKNILLERFAAVGTEVWQSSRVNNPTRNMSYDIRGQPLSAPFDAYISPWNVSTLPLGMVTHPNTPIMTKHQFENNSIGLTLPESKTIEHGYLAGWPDVSDVPSSWINPVLLNTEKRWGFYMQD